MIGRVLEPVRLLQLQFCRANVLIVVADSLQGNLRDSILIASLNAGVTSLAGGLRGAMYDDTPQSVPSFV